MILRFLENVVPHKITHHLFSLVKEHHKTMGVRSTIMEHMVMFGKYECNPIDMVAILLKVLM